MSTRACYRFFPLNGPNDWSGVVTVYRHHDGYPSGAAKAIEAALPHAWPLPRFEPDEFAAAFVRGNKKSAEDYASEYEAEAERPQTKISLTSWTRPANTGPTQATAVVAVEACASCPTKASTLTSVSPVTSPTSTMSGARTERSASPRTPRVNATTSGPSRSSSKVQSHSSSGASPSHVVPLSSS